MAFFIKLSDVLSRFLLWGLLVIVILLAILTSILRYYLPQANSYKDDISALISERIGYHIQADDIDARWRFFKPDVRLKNLKLAQEESGRSVDLDYLRVQINIVKSLYYRQIYFETIEIGNVAIVLSQNAQGQWFVRSAQSKEQSTVSLQSAIRQFWLIDKLSVQGIDLQMLPYQQQGVHFPRLSADLQSWLNEKILQITLDEQDEQRSKLVLHTKNQPENNDFSIDLYWRADQFPLHTLLAVVPNIKLSEESRINQEIWLRWQAGKLTGSGEFDVARLQLTYADKLWRTEKAQGNFYITQEDAATVFALPTLTFTLNEQAIELEKVKLKQAKNWQLQIQQLDLAQVSEYLQLIELPEKLQELRDSLAAKGTLKNIAVDFVDNDFLLQANLQQVSVGAWQQAPALDNVSGFVQASKSHGYVDLDAQAFVMHFPILFPQAMHFAQASGRVEWRIADNIRVGSKGLLQLDGDYGQAVGEFQLLLPKPENNKKTPGYLSIVVDLENGDARYRDYLLPRKKLDEKLLAWLDSNIHGGQVKQGSFIFHGPLDKFDLSDENNQILLWLDVDHAEISYADDFPTVKNIQGEFLLETDSAFARVERAQTLNLSTKNALVDVQLSAKKKQVDVQATLFQQPTQAVLEFLQLDKITAMSQGVLQQLHLDNGMFSGQVNVSVPLDAVDQLNVQVDSTFQAVDLALDEVNLTLQQLAGEIHFDLQKGFFAKEITGKLWQQAISASTPKGKYNQLAFQTQLQSTALIHWLQRPEAHFLAGEMAVQGLIDWQNPQKAFFTLHSDGKGLGINLPKPLQKAADELWQITLQMPLNKGERVLNLSTDQGVSLALLFAEGKVAAGLISVGTVHQNFTLGEIQLKGQLLELDVGQWAQAFTRYQQFVSEEKARTGQGLVVQMDKLLIRHLRFKNYYLGYVDLSASEETLGWTLSVQQRDIDANLLFSKSDRPLELNIKRIDLGMFTQVSMNDETFDREQISNIPSLNVKAEQALYQGADYGRWQFSLRQQNDELIFDEIKADVRHMQLAAISNQQGCALRWQLQENITRGSCHLFTDKIDQVFDAWSLPQDMVSKEFSLNIVDAYWQGSPADFSLMNSVLPMTLTLNNGYFADVDSSATDALKVLGVFNISNLVRRLKLDFADMTQKGLSFDKVRGQFLLKYGVVSSEPELSIKSASSSIKIRGSGDFNTEQLDLNMSVSLPLASNLPWIVALAAGLPAAAGVFLISKILGKQVNKLTTLTYHVSGDMQKPKVKFKSMFDIGSDKNPAAKVASEKKE